MRGEVSDEEYSAEADTWWDFIGPQLTNFRDPAILVARLAICLLSARPEEAPRLSEHLDWFFQVLEHMGKDLREPQEMLARHFTWAR